MSHSLALPPGRSGLPYIGETVEWARDPLHFAQERYRLYGPIWQTKLIGRSFIVMLGQEANKFILHSHMEHFSSRDGWGDTLYSLIGEGLSLQDGARHRHRRIMLQPAFHQQALGRYFAVMRNLTEQHLEHWMALPSLALFDGFKALAFQIAAQVLLGSGAGAELRALEHHFNAFNAGLFTIPSWNVPWTPFGQAIRARHALERVLLRIIEQRRHTPGDDALGLLLQATDEEGDPLSDHEIIDQVLLLLWAGHDTVTSMLTWVIYELNRHPAVLAELVDEQERVRGGGELRLEHLRQLPALDRVLRETERLHPPAPGGFRGVREPFSWGGYTVPVGWNVMYSIVFTHHQPELFHDPERFDPDRFGASWNEGRSAYSMIGFGGGPRVCIGLAMAQMELRIVSATLLQHATIKVLDNQNLTPVATPTKRPKDRLRVQVRAK
ncbi:MAG: cytochrome P450 [Herpetosiphonaceae bacterium]|nr:cytochrome P450 [Herpetosiphonaceae bacterium]